jgi:hypothetical protein
MVHLLYFAYTLEIEIHFADICLPNMGSDDMKDMKIMLFINLVFNSNSDGFLMCCGKISATAEQTDSTH